MKILVAPDKFKGSLSANSAAGAIGRGLAKVLPDALIDLLPMADGGDGTVEAVVQATNGDIHTSPARNPLGEIVNATWGIGASRDGIKTAVIEMSAASGLRLVEGRNKPLEATTFGTGQLIKAALDAGCRRIIIGIGGSATTDGGVGAAQALGVRFIDADGAEIGRGGGALEQLNAIDMSGRDPRLADCEILVACDVDNPLYGPRGAAQVYGPQKGADSEQIERLDSGLRALANAISKHLGFDVSGIEGAGAAGGLGAGLAAFAGANLVAGAVLVGDIVGLSSRIEGSDLVVTAEGRIDSQTARGKVPVGVSREARSRGIPAVAVAGSIGPGAQEVYAEGLLAIEPICEHPMTLAQASENAEILVEQAAERLMRMIMVGRLIG